MLFSQAIFCVRCLEMFIGVVAFIWFIIGTIWVYSIMTHVSRTVTDDRWRDLLMTDDETYWWQMMRPTDDRWWDLLMTDETYWWLMMRPTDDRWWDLLMTDDETYWWLTVCVTLKTAASCYWQMAERRYTIIQLLLCILPLEIKWSPTVWNPPYIDLRGTTLYMGDFKPLEIALSPTAKYTTGVV